MGSWACPGILGGGGPAAAARLQRIQPLCGGASREALCNGLFGALSTSNGLECNFQWFLTFTAPPSSHDPSVVSRRWLACTCVPDTSDEGGGGIRLKMPRMQECCRMPGIFLACRCSPYLASMAVSAGSAEMPGCPTLLKCPVFMPGAASSPASQRTQPADLLSARAVHRDLLRPAARALRAAAELAAACEPGASEPGRRRRTPPTRPEDSRDPLGGAASPSPASHRGRNCAQYTRPRYRFGPGGRAGSSPPGVGVCTSPPGVCMAFQDL
eukprot:gene24411-biopygen19418